MNAITIFNAMTTEQKDLYNVRKNDLMTVCKGVAKILADENKTDAEKKAAKALKSDAVSKVQEVVDTVYVETLIKSGDMVRAYFNDPYRPTVSCSISKKGEVNFSFDNTSGMKVYPFTSFVAFIDDLGSIDTTDATDDVKATAEKFKAIAKMLNEVDFDNARQTTAGYALQMNVDNSGEKRENLVNAYLSAGYSMDGMGKSGRNATEKAWQAIVDTLLGKTEDGKVYLRVKISMVNDFITFDHIFDRKANGTAIVCSPSDFSNRFVHVIHDALHGQTVNIVAPSKKSSK